MAFSFSYVITAYLLFEITINVSEITAETETSWNPMNGPFVLVRLKRNPQRAITYSGFNPTSGLTAFATSADFLPPYYNSYQSQFHYPIENRADPYAPSTLTSNRVDPYAPSASASTSNSSPPSDYTPSDYQPTAEYPSTNIADEDRKLIPSQNLIPPAEQAPNTAYNQNTFQAVKKPKKKPPQTDDDNDDQDENIGKSRSTSNASFNAWFPIVLGMYPTRGGLNTQRDDSNAGVQDRYTDRSLGTTVIANSVSNGRSSVASSHAIAYGGAEPMKSYSKT